MANVFVSHRTVDLKDAERLAKDLQDAGHQVWLDLWRIDVGDSIVERINEGLEGATFVVICYSAHGIAAPWMSREWMSALARQLNDRSVRLLPALLPGGKPPAIMADIRYADLSTKWSEGVSNILLAIEGAK